MTPADSSETAGKNGLCSLCSDPASLSAATGLVLTLLVFLLSLFLVKSVFTIKGDLSASAGISGQRASLPDMRVDINTADAASLCVLPGIGPNRAREIVTAREKHGPWQNMDQLVDVPGIGERTIRRIRPFVVISHPLATDDQDG